MTKILIACIPGIIAGMLVASIAFMLNVRQERKRAEKFLWLLKESVDYERRRKDIEK